MKKLFSSIVLLMILFCSASLVSAQNNDPVLLSVAGQNISKSEFLNIYKKNNLKNANYDQKSLKEYLELFINFRLKVKEAEDLKYDTVSAFKNELAGYRKQLAQPYLTDKEVTDKLIKEAYDRLKTSVRASHILIKVSSDALPKDTLIAYKKIMEIRNRIVKGEDFAKVANEVSDDPSAKDQLSKDGKTTNKGNGGDLGFFTALQMVYPFENVAYTTKKGSVSQPVRTQFGYHLVKVTDTKAVVGEIQVAHIMIRTNDNMTKEDSTKAKNKIDEIYTKVKAGEDFAELAKKNSEDRATASKGGVLPWFSSGRMILEFENAAYTLKNNGDYSEPIKTAYGWHIIKRLEFKPFASFDEQKADLKAKIAKDSRSSLSNDAVIARIKKENNFKENRKGLEAFYPLIDSSYFKGTWDDKKASSLTKELFNLSGKSYTQTDFAKYLSSRQSPRMPAAVETIISGMYKNYVNESCLDLENSKLENKYPEFKALVKEYRDGILLFELTDNKVWSKAVKDSIGLADFFEKNKQNYLWGKRVNAAIYTCSNEKTANETRALITKGLKQNEILERINVNAQLNLKVDSGIYSKGDNKLLDSIDWKVGISPNKAEDKSIVLVNIIKLHDAEPKSLNEAKGLVTADYQNFLEKEWLKSLRLKYPVVVNNEVLETIK